MGSSAPGRVPGREPSEPRHARRPDPRRRGRRTALAVVAVLAAVLLAAAVPAFVAHLAPSATQEVGDGGGGPASSLPSPSDTQPRPSVATPSPESASPIAAMLARGELRSIRLIGDSITAGYLCDGWEAPSDTGVVVYQGQQGSYEEVATTVGCWANDFRAWAGERGVSFVNAGVSGFRMQFLAEEPDAWLGDGADVVVVMLGTNDAAKESLEDFHAYAREALAAAAERCRLLVVVSPPANERTDARNRYGMDQADAVLAELCQEEGYLHVSLLDVLELGTDDLNPDQVHPTSSGSHKLWEALSEQLGIG